MIAELRAPATREPEPQQGSLGDELKTLARHSSHYLAGLLGGLVVGLVSFPIFTRALPVAEYGLMDLAQRTALILTIACKLGIQNAALRFYDRAAFEGNVAASRRYFSTLYLGVAATAIGAAAAFISASTFAPAAWISASLGNLILPIGALLVLRALGSILWAFLRIEERTTLFNVASVSLKLVTVALVCALLPFAGRTARTYFVGVVGAEGVFVAALTIWLFSRRVLSPAAFDSRLFRAGVTFGLPLVIYEFGFAILGSADRFLVRFWLGPDPLGFYSVAYGLAQHANDLLVTPLALAIQPIYLRLWNTAGAAKTQEFLSTSLDVFLGAAAAMLAIGAAVAEPLVLVLASSKYSGVHQLVPMLLAGLLVYATYVFVAAGLLIRNRTSLMAGILIVAAVANVALNCVLLPRMRLAGSAVATLLSYGLCVVLLARSSNRVVKLRFEWAALARYLAAGALAWRAGLLVDVGPAVANIAVRAAAAAVVYVAALALIDVRVRCGIRRLACFRSCI